MSFSLISRVMNPDLYNKSKSLLSNINCDRFSFTNKTDTEYHRIMFNGDIDDWVINFDEDAFIFNFERIFSLIMYMDKHGYHVCGMPDGGVIPVRRHNPVSMNPFFTIVNQKFTRQIPFNTTVPFTDDLKSFTPVHLMKGEYEYDNYQPGYYPIYFNLLKSGAKFLYLDAELLYPKLWSIKTQQTSTLLKDHNDDPFCIHSWYAREYNNSKFHTVRIDNDFKLAEQYYMNCNTGGQYSV